MKQIGILGATGSIGTSTLAYIRTMRETFSLAFVTAHTNHTKLAAIAAEFQCPAELTAKSPDCIPALIEKTAPDIVVNGIAGSAGLMPSYAVLAAGVDLALANKETLVMAWPFIHALAQKTGARILPVDSEHSALFILTERFGNAAIAEFIITASGGPFRTYSASQLQSVTVADALQHPTWRMGKKITIDSATLANKGLEVIEACRLFDATPEQVRVLVHPESIVHALVRTTDGVLYAQAAAPDMQHPIATALTWPLPTKNTLTPFSLADKTLSFFPPDLEKFPLLRLAYDAVQRDGAYPIAYNAANEIAVTAFMDGRIGFTDIARTVATVLEKDWSAAPEEFSAVFDTDARARREALESL
ncbi:MAG: 1-deoxy-D-xylulose-5-phosphate reductoisomerase [Treponema sp.]|nr:1-deoxy-D-xylulose-5-phosphate reductoisomerase [Treponema sp.]